MPFPCDITRKYIVLVILSEAIGTTHGHNNHSSSYFERKQRQRRRFLDVSPLPATTTVDGEISSTWPSLAWLLSYPGSDDGYISQVIHHSGGYATATNYGKDICQKDNDVGSGLPHISYGINGPFRRNDLAFPPRYILTTTHCTGHCLYHCPPNEDSNLDNRRGMYVYDRVTFLSGCGTGNIPNCLSQDSISLEYSDRLVSKAIHLIRSPFDNIVERFRIEHVSRVKSRDPLWTFSFDREGFMEWCRSIDDNIATKEDDRWQRDDVNDISKTIPCHGLFYQYALWHNSVFEVLGKYGHRFSVKIVHYNDWHRDGEGTLSAIFDFLEQPLLIPKNTPPQPRFVFRTFPSFFSQNDRLQISSFFKIVASQPLWVLIKRYLPPPEFETLYAPLGPILSPVHHGAWPAIAWLATFPNSGTYYTTQLVMTRSRATVATNYGNELTDRISDIPNSRYGPSGPFRYSLRPFATTYVLTKTHCTGYCIHCPPRQYITNEDEFRRGCARGSVYTKVKHTHGESMTDLVEERVSYDPSLAKKMVHLVRNPFDNIVARFHYDCKNNNNTATSTKNLYNKDTFRQWCYNLDQENKKQVPKWFDNDIADLIPSVPCYSIFYQYVQWHNNALELSRRWDIPSQLIYYEDFHFHGETTTQNLMNFLEYESIGKIYPFDYRSYPDYFSIDEKMYVEDFIKLLSSKECYEVLKRYFFRR